ncbi:hypothetical protein DDA98_14755 [Clostridium perfringens]|uniref:AIPR family protein n=1 Tax=Clostridium perfringens TaxID=1502 RepID=UPI000D510DD7|nr:AIPR family protein [Clostridium perfringens]ELC8457862.1 AIPR family protein [Clostridium perfringens]PVE14339.1 hypothetical protein DDA98_14755 [Clostridium perfringens]
MSTIKFENCKNIKAFANPITGKVESVEFLLPIQSLPSEDEVNTKTNPRERNTKTKVFKGIENSLYIPDCAFYKKNKGMLFSAKEFSINNQRGSVSVEFEDENCHGLCDGAHSFKAALNAMKKAEEEGFTIDHYIKVEIMIGIEDIFEDVVAARNSSVQVSDAAIAELKDRFNFIKNFLSDEEFLENISFKDNEISNITIKDVIAILFVFNIDRYSDDLNCPTQAFNATSSCLNDFLRVYKELDSIEDEEVKQERLTQTPYYKMKDVMVDFFKLYDKIEEKLPNYYHQATSKHLGNLSCVKATGCQSTFYNKNISCSIPKAFILPILGSFRALLIEEDGYYKWVANPFEYLDNYGPQLASEIIERYGELKSTTSLGRNAGVWRQLYRILQMKYMMNR